MEALALEESVCPQLTLAHETTINNEGGETGDKNNDVETLKKRRGKVKQRNYVLNDAGALRKKMRHEGKKHGIAISKEAKDCSNITVALKASFFEFVKANFIDDLGNNENVTKIENAECAKAGTESHGEAYVEYSMDITFKVDSSIHSVKLTAYTTQPLLSSSFNP